MDNSNHLMYLCNELIIKIDVQSECYLVWQPIRLHSISGKTTMKKFAVLLSLVFALVVSTSSHAKEKGFQTIFDGKSMKGWKASENKDSWKFKDGLLV